MGGLIYTVVVVGLALLMLSFFTIFNWIFGIFYDTGRALTATAGNARKATKYRAAQAGRVYRNSVVSRTGRKRFVVSQTRKANVRRGLDERGFKKGADGTLVDGLGKWARKRTDYRERRLERYEAGKDRGLAGNLPETIGGVRVADRVNALQTGTARRQLAAWDAAAAAAVGRGASLAADKTGGFLRAQVGKLARSRARVAPAAPAAPKAPPPPPTMAATPVDARLPPQAMAVALSARRRVAAATGTWMREVQGGLLSVHSLVTGTPRARVNPHANAFEYVATTTSSSGSEAGSDGDDDDGDEPADLTPLDLRVLEVMIEFVEAGELALTDHEAAVDALEVAWEMLGLED